MKGFVISVLLFLASCSEPPVDDPHPAITLVRSEFRYVAEVTPNDTWQTWQVTKAVGGDCEDFMIWTRHEMIEQGVKSNEIEIIRGKLRGVRHIAMRYKGYFVDQYGSFKFYPDFVIDGAYSSKTIALRLGVRRTG